MIPNKIVDGGFISWVYGSSAFGISSWHSVRSLYTQPGVFMAMDSDDSFRRDYFAAYKGRRIEKKMQPEMKAKVDMVAAFRNCLLEDAGIRKIQISGLEADDIIAILSILSPGIVVEGIDKDLRQLDINIHTHRGDRPRLKFPKGIVKLIQRGMLDIGVALSLLGDRSDSIPRVAYAREVTNLSALIGRITCIDAELNFGPDFKRNTMLALLPSPYCLAKKWRESYYPLYDDRSLLTTDKLDQEMVMSIMGQLEPLMSRSAA